MPSKKRDTDLLQTVGDNLRKILKKKKITAYRLSKDSDISEGMISSIVNKRSLPSLSTFKKLYKTLKSKPEDLLE